MKSKLKRIRNLILIKIILTEILFLLTEFQILSDCHDSISNLKFYRQNFKFCQILISVMASIYINLSEVFFFGNLSSYLEFLFSRSLFLEILDSTKKVRIVLSGHFCIVDFLL